MLLRLIPALFITALIFGCHIVGKKPESKNQITKEESSELNQENNERIEGIQSTFSTLKKILTPLNNQITSSMPSEPQAQAPGANAVQLVAARQNSYYTNAFALCADLFSELGVGNLDYSSTTGTYIQEFESLSARRITEGQARVFLVLRGQSADNISGTGKSMEISIKLVTDDSEEEFYLYRKGGLNESAYGSVKNIEGYSPSLVLSLDDLERFYGAMKKVVYLDSSLSIAGMLVALKNADGLKRYVSHNLSWDSPAYSLVVQTLDIITQKSGSFRDINIDASLLNRSKSQIGLLDLFVENLGEDSQKLYADIRYNKDGI